ncbi:MAG: hypothetical protein ACREBW_02265, partial [Candidatus Micrarchaeaceae archaeon]
IYFSDKALLLNPADAYTRDILMRARNGAMTQIRIALNAKNLLEARRLLDAYLKLVPSDPAGAAWQKKVTDAEEATKLRPSPKPVLTMRATYKLEQRKYAGTLTVVSRHLKFNAEGSGNSKSGMLDIPCSNIKDVKSRQRFLHIGDPGFLVVTKTGRYEFLSRSGTGQEVKTSCRP